MPRRLAGQAAALVLATLLSVSLASHGGAEAFEDRLRSLKLLQKHMLLSEPAEKVQAYARLRERLRKWRRSGTRVVSRQRRPEFPGEGPPEKPSAEWVLRHARTGALSAGATPNNVMVNDPFAAPLADPPRPAEILGIDQSEVSIAAYGNYVVAAWNDGLGYDAVPDTSTQGFGYSVDGGVTWVDGGSPPPIEVGRWNSDPVVTVDEKTGVFYYAALCGDEGDALEGIGVVRGSFCGGAFSWGTPVVAIADSRTTAALDKSWIVADSLSGNLYVSYSHFDVVGGNILSDRIRMVRSTDDGLTWSGPLTLSDPRDDGFVQGSRPAVGPDGELYVVWQAVGQSSGPFKNSAFGRDYFRLRKSSDFGATFGAQVTPDSMFSNFSNGGPGFNRGMGLTFPGIAVDRSGGPYRGRVYLTWNESLNFYDAPLTSTPSLPFRVRPETEPNDGHLVGTVPPFAVGDVLTGNISFPGAPGDRDFWKFQGAEGRTLVCYMDQVAPTLDPLFSIRCTDGITHLAFNRPGQGRSGFLVFTLPKSGIYFLRVASYSDLTIGTYRILTAWDDVRPNDRGRDHRDIFVKSSDDGQSWAPTVRVNDSPEYIDNWLPEVAVDGKGRVYVAHYDYRDEIPVCAGAAHVYLTTSEDGGESWSPEAPVTDVPTNWTTTYSTIEPNQGDYIGLFARDSSAFVAWADGRPVNPPSTDSDGNVFVTPAPNDCVRAPVTAVSTAGSTLDQIVVAWSAPAGFQATLYRRTAGAEADLGTVTADAGGQIVYQDSDVLADRIYAYRLGVGPGFCESSVCDVATQLPCVAAPVVTVEAIATIDSATVRWTGPGGFSARLLRREGSGPYVELMLVTADGNGLIVYRDDSVIPGVSYSYRLGVDGFCLLFVGQITVAIPSVPFALRAIRPNPTSQDIIVNFDLPNAEPATLTLYDINGRYLLTRKVGVLGPGPHVFNLTDGLQVKAGIYFVRLAQGRSAATRRVAIVR